jgi:hypothetical protein
MNQQETQRVRTVFGEVLAELMEERGLEPTPAQIIALGERSGLDGQDLLRDVQRGITRGGRRARKKLTGLADELGLTEPEKVRIALAYTFEDRLNLSND